MIWWYEYFDDSKRSNMAMAKKKVYIWVLRLAHTRLRNVRYYSSRTHTTSLKKELKEEDDLGPTFSSSFNFLWSFLHLTETKVKREKTKIASKKLCCRW